MHESCVGHETYFSGSVKEIATKYVNLKYILVLNVIRRVLHVQSY
jgi:hypothetical protein